jgi:hypothetical protein
MKPISGPILCDGCGQPASSEHIAARVHRLELATRYRPIHVGTLFVALAPPINAEQDFYNVEGVGGEPNLLLAAVGIPSEAPSAARLNEFQHQGYYLTYLSECALPFDSAADMETATFVRRSSTLIKRILFNYRPKHVAPLGTEVAFLIPILKDAGLGESLVLDDSGPLRVPARNDLLAVSRFQSLLNAKKPEASSPAVV